jgi:tetratricopeptide (TPR) repeat protein
MSSACQRLLVRAAILGGSFEFNTIRFMEAGGPDGDEDAILDLLEEALQAGMLTEEGSGTHITYHFWHPLLVSYLYDGLSAGRRASLHRRAAEVLRQSYQGREAEGAAAIAYHLVNGGADAPQIAHYAELAGDRAYVLSAYPEAAQHYRLTVEHRVMLDADASGEEQLHLANLLERLGECIRVQGNYTEVRSYFEQALEVHKHYRLSASDLDPQYEAQIEALLWCEVGRTWYDTGDYEHAQQCYRHGEQMLREAKVVTGPAWASLYLAQSFILWMRGKFEEARQRAHIALHIFEHVLGEQHHTVTNAFHSTATRRTLEGDPVDLGRTHRVLAALAASVGQSSMALEHLNTALAIFEQYDRQLEIAIICSNIGDAHLRKGELLLAQAALRRSLSIAERIGDASNMSVVFANLGILAARPGDLPEAEACHKKALVLAGQVNDPVYVSAFHAYLTTVMQDQGKVNEAKVSLRRALKISRAMNFTPCIGIALVVLGQLRIAQALVVQENSSGSTGTAKLRATSSYTHFLRKARISLQRALSLEGLEAETRTEGRLALAKVAFLLGEIDEARQQALQVMREAQRYEQIWLLACAQRLMGDIQLVKGQLGEADQQYEQGSPAL